VVSGGWWVASEEPTLPQPVTHNPPPEKAMRHRKAGSKFKRSPSHRQMLLRNLATSLLEHGRMETTLPKARAVQPFVEKLITLAKDGWNLNNFRRSLAVLTRKDVAFRLFQEIGPRFQGRPGGYTRIYKLAKVRQGDAAPMAVIALLGENEQIKAPAKPAIVPAAQP
jgi:large subunit ribosomal protein L17